MKKTPLSMAQGPLSERYVGELAEIFSLLNEGARVGFLSNDGESGQISHIKGQMVAWEVGLSGVSTFTGRVDGFPESNVHLLLVANGDTVKTLEGHHGSPGTAIAKCVAQGDLVIYYLIPYAELMDFGFQILFDALPQSFAGACR